MLDIQPMTRPNCLLNKNKNLNRIVHHRCHSMMNFLKNYNFIFENLNTHLCKNNFKKIQFQQNQTVFQQNHNSKYHFTNSLVNQIHQKNNQNNLNNLNIHNSSTIIYQNNNNNNNNNSLHNNFKTNLIQMTIIQIALGCKSIFINR